MEIGHPASFKQRLGLGFPLVSAAFMSGFTSPVDDHLAAIDSLVPIGVLENQILKFCWPVTHAIHLTE